MQGPRSGVTSEAPQHCFENNCHNIRYCDYCPRKHSPSWQVRATSAKTSCHEPRTSRLGVLVFCPSVSSAPDSGAFRLFRRSFIRRFCEIGFGIRRSSTVFKTVRICGVNDLLLDGSLLHSFMWGGTRLDDLFQDLRRWRINNNTLLDGSLLHSFMWDRTRLDDLFQDLRRWHINSNTMLDGSLLHSFMWGRTHLNDLIEVLRHWHTDSLYDDSLRDAPLRSDLRNFHNLFMNSRYWYTGDLFNNVLRSARVRDDLRDFHNLFLNSRYWYTGDLFNNVLRSARLRNDLRDFHNLFLNSRYWYTGDLFNNVLRSARLRDDLRDFRNLFLNLRHWHTPDLFTSALWHALCEKELDHLISFLRKLRNGSIAFLHKLLWYGLPDFHDFLLERRHRGVHVLLRRTILHELLWQGLPDFHDFLLERRDWGRIDDPRPSPRCASGCAPLG